MKLEMTISVVKWEPSKRAEFVRKLNVSAEQICKASENIQRSVNKVLETFIFFYCMHKVYTKRYMDKWFLLKSNKIKLV